MNNVSIGAQSSFHALDVHRNDEVVSACDAAASAPLLVGGLRPSRLLWRRHDNLSFHDMRRVGEEIILTTRSLPHRSDCGHPFSSSADTLHASSSSSRVPQSAPSSFAKVGAPAGRLKGKSGALNRGAPKSGAPAGHLTGKSGAVNSGAPLDLNKPAMANKPEPDIGAIGPIGLANDALLWARQLALATYKAREAAVAVQRQAKMAKAVGDYAGVQIGYIMNHPCMRMTDKGHNLHDEATDALKAKELQQAESGGTKLQEAIKNPSKAVLSLGPAAVAADPLCAQTIYVARTPQMSRARRKTSRKLLCRREECFL